MLLRLAALGALVVLAAGCGGAKKQADPSGLPPGCSPAEVDRLVTDFLTKPDLAPAGEFDVVGFNESDGRKAVLRTRTKALAYLRSRIARGERDRLIQLRVAKDDFNHARITFQLTRYAPDFRARGIHSRLASGAGTIDCAHGKVAAWVVKGP